MSARCTPECRASAAVGRCVCSRSAYYYVDRRPTQERRSLRAFTLIELLVVIAIIIILAGLLYPAYQAAQNQAKRTQAKNDLTQIVTAVNAYYTEYGKYPVATDDTPIVVNNTLFDVLRNMTGINPEQRVESTRDCFYLPA